MSHLKEALILFKNLPKGDYNMGSSHQTTLLLSMANIQDTRSPRTDIRSKRYTKEVCLKTNSKPGGGGARR